jgi:hypothetical protein
MNRKIFFVIAGLLAVISCEKDKQPENPYESVNYNTDTTTTATVDPNSIVGLHQNIFFPRCAKSGCHDGTFEPDYRTVMSTYSTLVYAPVIKPTVDSITFFKLRVKPFDANKSFIIERLTTSTSDYMPSNGNRLSSGDIDHIKTWINDGAKDQNGNIPQAPNLPPVVTGFYIIDQTTYQPDTLRLNDIGYNPVIVHPGQQIYVIWGAEDDSTAYPNLTTNQMRLSYDMDDYSSATTINAIYISFPIPAWVVPINSNNFTPNDTVFFRYRVNDGDHVQPTEFPRDDYPFYYKYFCSFMVQ